MIFFNVKEVRTFLIKHGFVLTIRKRGRRLGRDLAVQGHYKKYTKIGKVNIELIEPFVCPETLKPHIHQSGLSYTPEEWYDLAVKLHETTKLILCKVTLLK